MIVGMKNIKLNGYIPHPINTEDVSVSEEILPLAELLAKNTHEVWAAERIAQGWKYGEQRDDIKKTHPCLVPYEQLPEKEKEYDRNTSMTNLKLVLKLGFSINSEQH